MSDVNDDDLQLQNYQDDLDTSSKKTDHIMDEASDDPTKDLRVDPKEFKKELDQIAFDEAGHGAEDDRREDIESRDNENPVGTLN
jgi:hypothetical protein